MKASKLLALILSLMMALCMVSLAGAEELTEFVPQMDQSASLTLTMYGPGLFASTGAEGSIDLTSGITTPGYNEVVARWATYYPNVKLDIQPIPWSDWQANVTTAVMWM